MTVETVVRDIDLPAREPLRPRRIPFENAVPLAEPVKLARYVAPELFRVGFGLPVDSLVFGKAFDVGFLAELRGRLKGPALVQD